MQTIPQNNFWQFDAAYWFQRFGTSAKGLSQIEAEKILVNSNQFIKKPSHFQKDLLLFISQFKSPLMLLLIGAVILWAKQICFVLYGGQ